MMTDEPPQPFALPDARGWEMVSPVEKNGGEIQGFGGNFGGGVLQAAAAGGAITYTSSSSFANSAGRAGREPVRLDQGRLRLGDPEHRPSRRSRAATRKRRPRRPVPALLRRPRRRAAQQRPPLPDTPERLPGGKRAAARLRRSGGLPQLLPARQRRRQLLTALLTGDRPAQTGAPPRFELAFAGATPDLAHLVFSTCAALTADATEVAGSRRRMRSGQTEPLREVGRRCS